ncbi:MAG: ABC transporter ATP-binding protein [Eubacterium sp.]
MAVFKTENLTFSYPKSDKKAVDNVNIQIEKGELVLLMGESGNGKSTFLRLLKKELSPFGKITGNIVSDCKNIAFVQQNPDTSFVSETVRGELVFALENRNMTDAEIAVRLGEISSFFNINDILDSKLSCLSGGEKATVSIAAAMIDNADVLILDEPFAQLDPKAVLSVSSMLKRINTELGVTVIMASHTCAEVIDFCDRLIVLRNGRCICNTSVREAVKENSLLDFFPAFTSLFDERPLTVKEAIPLSAKFSEKPLNKEKETEPAVVLKNITFAYGKSEPDILNRLSYIAYRGKINSIIGSNGSGKTTLLKVMGGIKKAYSGNVKATGKICYMPQNVRYLFTKDAVGEEISLATAEKLGIADCINQHPFDLSGGQAQKLAFGILLEQNADIFLLDEPSKTFDTRSKKILTELLKSLCKQGKTVIMVSHDIDFVGEISDYVSFLSDGIISSAGDRRQVLSSLKFYTTQIRRITAGSLEFAVSAEDLV